MATVPILYCIHGADAPQHLGKIQQIAQKFKQEQRITNFIPLSARDALTSLPGKFGQNDLMVLLLTNELEPSRKEITSLLSQAKFPESRTVEVIVDNIQFVNDYITLPMDLKPIRDVPITGSAWQDIEENLRKMLPTTTIGDGWKKYLKYAIAIVLVGLVIWWLLKRGDVEAAFNASVTECEAPCEIKFTNNSKNASTYEWNFGDGTASAESNPTHVFQQAGTYKVNLKASKDGRQKEQTLVVKVTSTTPGLEPKAAFSSNATECNTPCNIAFTNSSQNADKYRWEFGDGSSSEETSPSHTYNSSGTFTVKLTASGNDKENATTNQIVVRNTPAPTPAPIAGFTPNRTNCVIPCTITFTNQSQNATAYNWDFGDGTASTEANASHRYTAGGDYQVRLVARNSAGQNEVTGRITVTATVNVPSRQISTSGDDAQIVRGDGEIDSDDWTSVELSYSLRISDNRKEVQLILNWYAQERNSDRTAGNTRFKSSKTFTVFNITSCCPGTVIDDIQGIDSGARGEEYYRGEAHGFKPFPTTGSLQGIQVQFDGDGGHDERLQRLRATLQPFSLRLRVSN